MSPPARQLTRQLTLVRATSLATLADRLSHQLATAPPDDPMAPIDVAVPSRGMERWLTQRLAADLGAATSRDGGPGGGPGGGEQGICANVRFPFAGAIVQRTLHAVLGEEAPDDDPWAPQRLAWPLLTYLADLPDDPVHAPLRAHLADTRGTAQRRRYPLARRIADLFDRYTMYRPRMVQRWADGHDVDADGEALPANVAWQPPLWRHLLGRLGTPSLDDRFRRAIATLNGPGPGPGPSPGSGSGSGAGVDAGAAGGFRLPDGVPRDVTVVGVMSLPPLHLELLAALATHTPVTIHVLTPCATWEADVPAPTPRHPLLASCGIVARDGHDRLARHAGGATTVPPPATSAPATSASAPAASALAALQADVRADRARHVTDHPSQVLAADDRSVQVHACHSPTRQLEVLREALFGLLDDDPTLQPRDIAVLTPDIAAFDPVITAVFSDGDRAEERAAAGASGVPTLPFRIADRTVRDDNVVAHTLLTLLELVPARVGASSVLDLLAATPISTRFGLTATDLTTLPDWVLGTGISWGIDADHRQALIGLDDGAHTWQAGLDRLVLGAAMADDGTRDVDGTVPYDDVEGADAQLLGRVLAATDTLFACLRALRDPRPIAAWQQQLAAVVDQLLDPGAAARRDADLTAQLAAVRDALTTMVADSAGAGDDPSEVTLTLEELRAVLGPHLGQASGRAQYGTGAITFAGLEPLRNVPHRVVCLIGLDDGALPRAGHRYGFDLMGSQPRPGDPDPRVEDRQLFLDAVLAARDHLVVTYTGRDARTNEVQQPAVPVSELLDVLDGTLHLEDGATGTVRDRLVTSHPLQPHSARYFRDAHAGQPPVPRAFDARQLDAARAATEGPRHPARSFFAGRPLPPPGPQDLDPEVVELADLVTFLEHPVRHLLQRRVGLSLGEDDRRLEDRDPTELDGLGRWKLGQELLDRTLAGDPPPRWRELTLAAGTSPVGALGEVALDGIEELVDRLCAAVADLPDVLDPVPVDLTVPLPGEPDPDGTPRTIRLLGTVELRGTDVAHVSVSTLRGKHRLATWTRLLAATAARPELQPTARLLGKDTGLKAGYRDEVLLALEALADDEVDATGLAHRHLGELIALYQRGHREPLLLPPDLAHRYASERSKGKDHHAALGALLSAWEGGPRTRAERDDAYLAQAFGADADLLDLVERTTFAADALQVWGPYLQLVPGR